ELHADVAQPKLAQDAHPGLLEQGTDALDREHLARKLREHGSLIAATRAHFEHAPQRPAGARQLAHARNGERLRDRLAVPERERYIVVSPARQSLVDEDMARNFGHRAEHRLVAHACGT